MRQDFRLKFTGYKIGNGVTIMSGASVTRQLLCMLFTAIAPLKSQRSSEGVSFQCCCLRLPCAMLGMARSSAQEASHGKAARLLDFFAQKNEQQCEAVLPWLGSNLVPGGTYEGPRA